MTGIVTRVSQAISALVTPENHKICYFQFDNRRYVLLYFLTIPLINSSQALLSDAIFTENGTAKAVAMESILLSSTRFN